MKNHLFAAATASLLLASSVQGQVITGYDITNVRLSGFGGWTHTYTGTITPVGGDLYNYSGGGGTLNDGLFGNNNFNSELFTLSDQSVFTLFLDGNYTLTNLNLYGSFGEGNFIPGTLTGATIGFGGSSAAITSTPFSVGPMCSSGPCDDAFSFAGTALAGLSGNQITLSDFQGGWVGDYTYYSISEIDTQGGLSTTTPEPSSVVLLFSGLVAVFGAARRKLNFPSVS
ncbi:MAG TPA: PEP-CTERM sorting domain-containing protein [Gemmatimonadaceae bacterium]